jgi:DNA-binding NtrC family response regulator
MRSARGESGSREGTTVSVAAPPRPAGQEKLQPAQEPVAPAGHAQELSCGQETLVFSDPASTALVELLTRIAPSDVPVLIRGETGTGKGLVARYVHEASGRTGPFLAVNCRAIAEAGQGGPYAALIRTTDGGAGNTGWFEAAARGTLFLDELGDLPLDLQAKLLCALEDRESIRTGVTASAASDVRIVAATRVDLGSAVAAGRFRVDLLYRLNIAEVVLLPLRERVGDVVALADYFIRLYARRLTLKLPTLGTDARSVLTNYSWPGNVRELENVIRFALLAASPTQELRTEHLRLCGALFMTQQTWTGGGREGSEGLSALTLSGLLARLFQTPGGRLLERLEGEIVGEAFRFAGQNQVRTATLLGISRNVLRTLLKKHGLYEVRAYSSADAASLRGNGGRRRGD